MTAPLTPALTAEEWAGVAKGTVGIVGTPNIHAQHQVAAVALYGQPFGFSRADVTLLETAINPLHGLSARDYDNGQTVVIQSNESRDRQNAALRDLADRIEALLPPEGSAP